MGNPDRQKLAPGLYLIATPIGAARDITLRALDILASADILVAEDTRSLRHLLGIHGIALEGRSLWAYHDHNGARMRPRILAALEEGKTVAYASEAGTPMVSDPGYDLARDVIAKGYDLISAPGPSAVLTALTLAGLPTDRFLFAGFLPSTSGRRKQVLKEIAEVPATLVFYESPRRVFEMLEDAVEILGGDRPAAVCRELTKKFEETRRGSLADLAREFSQTPPKGEIVVVIDRFRSGNVSDLDLDSALRNALATLSVRDATDAVVADLGLPKRQVYQRALSLIADK